MKTLAEIIAWLKTPDHISTILVEATEIQGGPSSSLYLSNKPFVTSATDTPANTRYEPCVIGGISFNESLSLSNTVSLSYGDIEIDNTYGVRDAWLNYVWANRPVNIYIGDVRWVKNDFRLIFSGVIADIGSKSLSTINLSLHDKLQRLNNPVSETLLPTINTTADVLVPVTFGEVFNVTPIVTDNIVNTLEYQVHTGAVEDIIEVRDNGVPVGFTKNLAAGKFTLNQSPYGQITCSVQGHKNVTYYNDIANIIKEIVKNFGPTATRLVDADIDLTNFSGFSTAHTQAVGTYSKDNTNILSVCNELAGSIGAQLTMSSVGLLRLVQLVIPSSGTSWTVGYNDVEADSVVISDKSTVRAATKLGYCKNWTPQEGDIAAGIPSQNVDLFNTEWLFSNTVDSSVQSTYRLTSAPVEEQTLLLQTTDADAESLRRNNLWKTPRFLYSMKAYAHLLPVELGDSVILTDNRFGLLASKTGTVVSISRNWLAGRVTIGVLV